MPYITLHSSATCEVNHELDMIALHMLAERRKCERYQHEWCRHVQARPCARPVFDVRSLRQIWRWSPMSSDQSPLAGRLCLAHAAAEIRTDLRVGGCRTGAIGRTAVRRTPMRRSRVRASM